MRTRLTFGRSGSTRETGPFGASVKVRFAGVSTSCSTVVGRDAVVESAACLLMITSASLPGPTVSFELPTVLVRFPSREVDSIASRWDVRVGLGPVVLIPG